MKNLIWFKTNPFRSPGRFITAGFLGLFVILNQWRIGLPENGNLGLSIQETRVYAATCNVRNYGAYGDGTHCDRTTTAIQDAIDDCASQGGGDVIFDNNGTYCTGNIFMRSNVKLVIQSGSTIQASNWYADYDPQDCDDDNVCDNVAPLISANNVSNIGIEGGGTIRGISGISYGNFYCPGNVVCDWDSGGASYGPSLVFFGDVSHGTIRNVRIEKCDNATVAIAESDNILIEDIYLHSNIDTLNNDTLNIYGSQYVTLRGNVIESGDDAICLKMRGPYNGVTMTSFNKEDMHDITIENNTVYAPFGGGGLVVGHWEVYYGEVYNVWFKNNIIKTGTQVPLLFKDRDVGETAHLHDIYFENNKWDTGALVPCFSLWTPTYECQRWNIFFNGQDLHDTMPGQVDSAEACGGTTPNPPSAPTNLTAQAVSSSQINLSWQDNSNNETGFKIERSTSATSGFTQIATVGANVTSYSNTGLSANTTYYYKVRAYNSAGNSGYSNTASATTQQQTTNPPTAPSGLTATVVSSSQINLSWQDNSNNETGFKIERGAGSNPSSWSEITTVGANVTSYSNTGLAVNTTYSYRVRAYNSGGNSGYSNTATATTQFSYENEDINQDGQVDVVDVQLCVNVFLGTETNPDIVARADVNQDGSVNVIDVQRIVNVFLEG